jgi:allose kinase
VSTDKKIVYQSPNISGFDNLNVAEPLEDAVGVPVFVDNDVNNLLIGEIMDRDLEDCGTVIGIYFGTGLGNAIYINGSILEGKHGVAGELGHIPVLGKTDCCGCGNSGCIEMYASGKKLEQIVKKYFPGTDIKDIFVHHAQSDIIKMFIEALSIPIAIEINILDPDYIIIGGGVINIKGFPKEELEKCVYDHTRKPHPAKCLELVYTNGENEAGVRGAAYNAFKMLGITI